MLSPASTSSLRTGQKRRAARQDRQFAFFRPRLLRRLERPRKVLISLVLLHHCHGDIQQDMSRTAAVFSHWPDKSAYQAAPPPISREFLEASVCWRCLLDVFGRRHHERRSSPVPLSRTDANGWTFVPAIDPACSKLPMAFLTSAALELRYSRSGTSGRYSWACRRDC